MGSRYVPLRCCTSLARRDTRRVVQLAKDGTTSVSVIQSRIAPWIARCLLVFHVIIEKIDWLQVCEDSQLGLLKVLLLEEPPRRPSAL